MEFIGNGRPLAVKVTSYDIGGVTGEMGRRWYFSVFLFIGVLTMGTQVVPVFGEDVPPMVEKHIFSPETVKEVPGKDVNSPAVKQIERKIVFSGVIITPQGRRAMIEEKTGRRSKGGPELFKEGDEIDGMILREIGSNYIVVASEGKDLRLNLYQGEKNRPAPPVLPKVAEPTPVPAASGKSGVAAATGGTAPGKKLEAKGQTPKAKKQVLRSGAKTSNAPSVKRTVPESSNPFLQALKNAARQRRESGATTNPSASNAFLEAIKRAKEQ